MRIMENELGRKLKSKEIVDHIDTNGLNNKINNLRLCSNSENLRNRTIPSDNKSGAMGVYYCKQTKKWCAEIKVNGVKVWLGRHREKESAINIRKSAEKTYWGEFAPQHERETSNK